MHQHGGGYGQLKGEWVHGFIFDLSFRGFAKAKKVPRVTKINFNINIHTKSRGKVMRINEMIPKGKSYHLQSNRPIALVDHVINFLST